MFCVFSQECEDGTDHGNNFVCPLCTLDFSSPEKLISHVYQVRPTYSHGKTIKKWILKVDLHRVSICSS